MLQCSRSNDELRVVTMTICLCQGCICESYIRCSWPPPPRGLRPTSTRGESRVQKRGDVPPRASLLSLCKPHCTSFGMIDCIAHALSKPAGAHHERKTVRILQRLTRAGCCASAPCLCQGRRSPHHKGPHGILLLYGQAEAIETSPFFQSSGVQLWFGKAIGAPGMFLENGITFTQSSSAFQSVPRSDG